MTLGTTYAIANAQNDALSLSKSLQTALTTSPQMDAKDEAWGQLKVRQDANSNGITDAGELKSLAERGVASLDLVWFEITINGSYGNTRASSSFTWSDGTQGQSADVLFETNGRVARSALGAPLGADILALPELPGSGQLKNLRAAMADDPVLKARLQSYRALAARGDGYLKSGLLFAPEMIAICTPYAWVAGRFCSRTRVVANDAAWELAA